MRVLKYSIKVFKFHELGMSPYLNSFRTLPRIRLFTVEALLKALSSFYV